MTRNPRNPILTACLEREPIRRQILLEASGSFPLVFSCLGTGLLVLHCPTCLLPSRGKMVNLETEAGPGGGMPLGGQVTAGAPSRIPSLLFVNHPISTGSFPVEHKCVQASASF